MYPPVTADVTFAGSGADMPRMLWGYTYMLGQPSAFARLNPTDFNQPSVSIPLTQNTLALRLHTSNSSMRLGCNESVFWGSGFCIPIPTTTKSVRNISKTCAVHPGSRLGRMALAVENTTRSKRALSSSLILSGLQIG